MLKIEEEIQAAIEDAKSQKDEDVLEVQGGLFGDNKWEVREGKRYYNFGDVEDDFWGNAEQLILSQLERYAETAVGLDSGQKRLFAADAAKGFAFVDLSQKFFDVVLMNPPFGQGSIQTRTLIDKDYGSVKGELAACFISRARSLLVGGGKVGCLATRLLLSLPTYEKWRHEEFIGKNSLSLLADLGYGVLDAAVVEAAAYIQSKGEIKQGVFIDCLQNKKKEMDLKSKVKSITVDNVRELKKFAGLPASVIAHFISNESIEEISRNRKLLDSGIRAYKGINTSDDFRFLRLSWELFPSLDNIKWKPFAKGGEWNPFWDDIHLEVNWNLNGVEINSAGGTIRNFDTQGKAGLTYPERTTSSFGPRVLPETTIYSSAGMGIFSDDLSLLLSSLPLMLSRQGQFLVEMSLSGGDSSVSGTAARHYTNGMINRLPFPELGENGLPLEKLSLKIIELKRNLFQLSEVSRNYQPNLFRGEDVPAVSLNNLVLLLTNLKEQAELLSDMADYTDELFGFDESDLAPVVGPNLWRYSSDAHEDIVDLYLKSDQELISIAVELFGGGARYITKNCQLLDRKIELIAHITQCHPVSIIQVLLSNTDNILTSELIERVAFMILSFSVGSAFGRWQDNQLIQDNIFDPPQSISYGEERAIFVSEDGGANVGSLNRAIEKYLSSIGGSVSFNAIKEVVGRPKDSNLWSSFFDFHLSEYSKSRRQAPIYWPLQTASGSYTLWVCFHSIDEQVLYRCVNDFLEGPTGKIAEINNQLSFLKSKQSRSKEEEKDLERLGVFEDELKDFRDELLRIAQFWVPDHNDGVLVVAAPLWRLFGNSAFQKTLKNTWSNLEIGNLDWSIMAYNLWPERVIHKCVEDRSIAIAHDLEGQLWEEVEKPAARGNGIKRVWQAKSLTSAELQALVQAKSE